MKRLPDLAVGFVFGFAVLLLIFLFSSDIAAHYEICETTKEGAKECARYGVVSFALREVAIFIDSYNGLITAIATAFIAWFTLSLRQSTDKLWDAGERQLANLQSSSERQLRAYVFIEKTPITEDAGDFTVVFSIKNFGQTPAHNVVVEYAFEAVDCTDKVPTRIPVADENYSLGSIAPLTDFYELDAKLTGVSLASVQRGDKAIYLNGSVTYDTVFTQGRVTNFRYLVGGEIGWYDNSEMSADDEGNGAT